ncbi:MAG: hypothetical protein Q8936_18675 [Bacillota bacterium]|nr:hypothetical protein [Bacillota bacterium]
MSERIASYEMPEFWSAAISIKDLKYELMEIVMTFILLFPTAASFSYYAESNVKAEAGSLLVVLFPLAMTTVRRTVKNIYISIVLHLIIAAMFFIVPLDASKHFFFILYIIYCVYSSIHGYFRVNRKFWNYSSFVLGEVSLCISALIWSFKDDKFIYYTIILMAAVFALIFIVYYSKSRIERLVVLEKQYDYNSVDKVKTIYNKFITSILGVLVVGYVILYSIFGSITWKIEHFSKMGLLTALAAVGKVFGGVRMEQLMKNVRDRQKNMMKVSFADTRIVKHDSKYDAIGNVLGVIITIIGITLLVIYFYTLVRYFYFNFIKGTKVISQDDDEKVERIYLKNKNIEKLDNNIDEIRQALGINITEREKVRRRYKKVITKYRKKGIMPKMVDTTSDIKTKINNSTGDNIDRLTEIYQKVRYSKEGPTDNEIIEVKRFK